MEVDIYRYSIHVTRLIQSLEYAYGIYTQTCLLHLNFLGRRNSPNWLLMMSCTLYCVISSLLVALTSCAPASLPSNRLSAVDTSIHIPYDNTQTLDANIRSLLRTPGSAFLKLPDTTINEDLVIRMERKGHGKKVISGLSKTVIVGQIHLLLWSDSIELSRIDFIRTKPYGNSSAIVSFGDVTGCLARNISFQDESSMINQSGYFVGFYKGFNNRLINCRFTNKFSDGHVIVQSYSRWPAVHHDAHEILNSYFGPKASTGNGADACIRIGLSGGKLEDESSSVPFGFLIQGNTFDRYSSFYQLISIKASGCIIRDNKFLSCNGYVSIRNASNTTIENNLWSGNSIIGSRGVRIQGPGHIIRNNRFRDLESVAIWLMYGSGPFADTVSRSNKIASYPNVDDIVVEGNIIDNCGYAFRFSRKADVGQVSPPKTY